MKMKNLTNSVLALVLAFSMMLGMCSTAFAAEENSINYVSLGASNVNGYGLEGYLPEDVTVANKDTANVFGYKRIPDGSYVDLLRDELTNAGYTVTVNQLAMSSMRAEELRILLDENYNTFDKYTEWRFTNGANWFNNAGGLENLRRDYKVAIESADLITVDIGLNNFGVYLSNQLSSGGTKYDDDLSLIDPTLASAYDNAKEYVRNLVAEHVPDASATLEDLDFVVDAMAYAYAGFCVNFDKIMEQIYTSNPDATVVAISIQNLMEGLEATVPGVDGTIPFGDLFGALIDAANLYIAVGSPYSNDYFFADVSENGRVEFFLDQLLAYDGDPSSLDKDMTDCFDIYDDDLMAFAGSTVPSLPAEHQSAALNVGHDVLAEIMQLGVRNNVLDLETVLTGGYGAVENALLNAIESELENAIVNVMADPTFTYTIDENFFNNIADTASVPRELVNTVATLGIRTGIGNSFYGHPNRNGHIEVKDAVMNTLNNEIYGIDALKNRLGITAEDEAKANEIIAKISKEVREIVDLAKNGSRKEQIEKIYEYYDILKKELNISEEDEATINAFAEDIKEIITIISTTSKENAKSEIDAYIESAKAEMSSEFKKLGHKKYQPDADSYYVAIGGDTVRASNIGRDERTYYEALAKELEIDNSAVYDDNTLLPSEVLSLIDANATEIAKADLITYQADASSFIYALLTETPDWNRYIDAETQILIKEILNQATNILSTDWLAYGDAAIEEFLPTLKDAVKENLPEEIPFSEPIFNALAEACVKYVRSALSYVSGVKNTVATEINALDETVLNIAENLAYACVAYAVDTSNAIDSIREINPDATLLVLGMYNPIRDLRISNNGEEINIGEYFEYAIDATNLYYLALAANNKEFAFVDVSSAATDGFTGNTAISISEMSVNEIGNIILDAANKMNANAAGHEYIKEQIIKSFGCDYSVYEKLNDTHHTVKCALCGDGKAEKHTLVDGLCTKCGYEKPKAPAQDDEDDNDNGINRPSYSGGGGIVIDVANEFVVTFETNGGSKIASVTVKKGELLDVPTAPTKEGFIFDGWFTDKSLTSKYNFATPVTKNFTLYAKWISSSELKFIDVNKNAWYYEYVKTVVEKGLMRGISETEFAPEAPLTRAMFVTILHRLEGEPAESAVASFADVPQDSYYTSAVNWASKNGIVNGVSSTSFAPDAKITREQMATIIVRYANYKNLVANDTAEVSYTDSSAVSDYAKDAVVVANQLRILLGNADGSFAPQRNSTRAEAAALFVRLINIVE